MTGFLIALQFLTRIPVQLKQQVTEKQIAESLLFYPFVGLLIGLVLYISNFMLSDTNDMLCAVIVLIIWVLITGALHLDGLADSADALVGGFGDKDKTLAIMKDPYCGPVGVVSIVLVLLLKFVVIYSLTPELNVLLILSPCLARASVLWSFLTTPYVRGNGLGSAMAKNFSRFSLNIILVLISIFILLYFGWMGLTIVFVSYLIMFLIKHILMKRIGGMTGDTLGAQIEILEPSILLIGILFMTI